MVTVDPAAPGTDNDRSTGRPRLTGNSDAAGPNQRRVADMTERPRSYTRVSVYGLLRLAAEVAAGQPFAAYCRAALLEPMNLSQTGFSADERSSRVVLGHSHLGTPLRPSVVADEFETDGSLFITAGDVARMIAQTMGEPLVHEDHGIFLGEIGHDGDDDCRKSHEQSAGEPASRLDHAPIAMTVSNTTPGLGRRISGALDLVTRFDAALGGGLGLAVQRVNGGRHEDADARPNDDDSESILELAESACGIVCLARWNPHTGRGIVILCNSATASPAAQRIAHKALGGSGH
jgi:hypothetical protein